MWELIPNYIDRIFSGDEKGEGKEEKKCLTSPASLSLSPAPIPNLHESM